MAFPSNVGTQALGLAQALPTAQGLATTIKTQASSLSAQCAAGGLQASAAINFLTLLADSKVKLQQCAAVPGISAYAQAQLGDVSIATEFTTMLAAMDAVTAWVTTNFPVATDATNYTSLATMQFDQAGTGRIVQRTFTAGQTAGLKSVLDALVATIN
jgi:hypothetical protein